MARFSKPPSQGETPLSKGNQPKLSASPETVDIINTSIEAQRLIQEAAKRLTIKYVNLNSYTQREKRADSLIF
jgi:hypothetical protein